MYWVFFLVVSNKGWEEGSLLKKKKSFKNVDREKREIFVLRNGNRI